MKRNLSLIVALALAGFAAWSMLGDRFSRRPDGVAEGVESVGGTSVEPVLPVAASEPSRNVIVVEEEPAAARKGDPGARVLVRTDSNEPAAGAEVWFADETEIEARVHGEWFFVWRDAEEVLAAAGRKLAADDDGRVRLPPTRGWTFVAARRGDEFACEPFDASKTTEVVIELERDETIIVEVVDAAGGPRPDVPVVLVERMDMGYPIYLPRFIGAARPGDTFVRIPHARWLTRAGRRRPSDVAYRVRPYVTLDDGTGRESAGIDPEALPSESIRVVAPPTGRIRVRVEERDGSIHRGGTRVSVGWGGSHSGLYETRIAKEGDVVFPHAVVPGRATFRVALDAQPLDPITVVHEGPRVEGAEIVVVARRTDPRETNTVLVGRLLDPDGAPFAHATIAIDAPFARGAPFDSTSEVPRIRTDRAGRFDAVYRAPRGRRLGPDFLVHPVSSDDRIDTSRAGMTRRPDPLSPGVHDVGDVRLTAVPFLVGGTVARADGSPVEGAAIRVAVRRMNEENPLAKLSNAPVNAGRVHTFTSSSGSDGRFAFHLESVDEAGTVSASKDGHASSPVPFTRGARDVALSLPLVGSIEARIELDDGVPRNDVEVHLEDEGGRRVRVWPGPDGTYRSEFVAAGTWRVRVSAPEEAETPVAIVDGIDVAPNETSRDPRLNPLDLRGRFSLVRLECVDARGTPVPGVRLAVPSRGRGAEHLGPYGRAHLVTARPQGLDLVLAAPGFRPRLVDGARGVTRVSLRDGLPVRVRLHLEREIPGEAAFSVNVQLERTSPVEGALAPYGHLFGDAYGPLENREARLTVAVPGEYRLRWNVYVPRTTTFPGFSRQLDDARTIVVEDAGETIVDVTPSRADLDEIERGLDGWRSR